MILHLLHYLRQEELLSFLTKKNKHFSKTYTSHLKIYDLQW